MRQRWLTYLTVVFTLLSPVFGVVWARSYLYDQTFYRIGNGRALVLSCIRGELAMWSGPARGSGAVRYAHESSDAGFAMTAREIMARDESAASYWAAGFGYARTYALSPPGRGPVRCVAVPLWFPTLLALAFPLRVLLRNVQRSRAAAEAELARCRRCGAALAAGETRCGACSFPAFIRRGAVA